MINQQQGAYGNLHGLLRWARPASVTKGAPSSESETSAIHRSTAARMSLVARLYVLKSSDRKRLQSIRGYMQQVTSHVSDCLYSLIPVAAGTDQAARRLRV